VACRRGSRRLGRPLPHWRNAVDQRPRADVGGGDGVSGVRAHGVVVAAGLVYLLGLGFLLIAPLRIVRYHTLFWELTGRYVGLGWTAAREQALDAAVNVALFVPLGFLGHRWWRAGSPPSWARRRGPGSTRSSLTSRCGSGTAGRSPGVKLKRSRRPRGRLSPACREPLDAAALSADPRTDRGLHSRSGADAQRRSEQWRCL